MCIRDSSFSLQDNSKALGDWDGKITTPQGDLALVIHLTEKDKALVATMDSPAQNAFGMAMDEASFKEGVLKMKMTMIDGTYEGTLKDGKFIGKWKQSGQTFDLSLIHISEPTRPY
eukprot:TRINITY_DN11126_c0_g1_i1.p1 TRINITY_DN11126_c0_g1~~TRINITY_DN11126_c0_g1_i1.p1  ORF type:complete len:116 (-),score=24.84 TRINITY_DN11126_c0_g1_i1:129-476(-)